MPTVDDTTIEDNEPITIGAATSYNATPVIGTGTILDNDAAPGVIDVTSPTIVEGGNLDFVVSLSNGQGGVVSLQATSGTATYGTDTTTPVQVSLDGGNTWTTVVLTGGAGNVTVPAGASSFIVRVPTVDDALIEPTEAFTLSASTTTNVAPVQGTGTILDNDAGGLQVSGINDPTIVEGGNLDFTVTLNNTNGGAVVVTPQSGTGTLGTDTGAVQYSTNGGTTWQTLTLTGGSGTVNGPAGQGSFLVRVPTTDDATVELTENVRITAGTSNNTAPLTGVGTILDNDSGFQVSSITSPTIVEGGNLDFTVSFTNTVGGNVTLTPAGVGAVLGTDTGTIQYSTNRGTTWQTI